MVKGKAYPQRSSRPPLMLTICLCSACQLRHVLSVVDAGSYPGIDYLVHDLRHARQRALSQCRVHCECLGYPIALGDYSLDAQSIALFNMVRTPLNVIPSWIVQILQVRYIEPCWPI